MSGRNETPIAVRGLVFAYPGAREPVVRGLDFAVERGEIFGFLGPNAAGKSTTQKILIGLLRGWRGSVGLLGRDLARWRADDYERIGVSFELPNHYLKLTALENLRYFAALYSRAAGDPLSLLERVALREDADRLVSQYSKGMKTRLGIARALLHDPELLFLDEPTGGLDPVNARRIRELIRAQRAAGKTVFLTTHDMVVADELCDRVALIVDGEIRRVDSPRRLKLEHGERRVRVEYGEGRSAEFPLDGLGDDARFLELLRTQRIETIHTREATLEDVFVRVTGKSLT